MKPHFVPVLSILLSNLSPTSAGLFNRNDGKPGLRGQEQERPKSTNHAIERITKKDERPIQVNDRRHRNKSQGERNRAGWRSRRSGKKPANSKRARSPQRSGYDEPYRSAENDPNGNAGHFPFRGAVDGDSEGRSRGKRARMQGDGPRTGRDHHSRIIGGLEAAPHQHSFVVSLSDEIGHFCGGSLIARNVVLSAAHCRGKPYNVLLGRHDLDADPGQEIRAARELPHPEYDVESTDNDFMLVFLDDPATLNDDVKLVSLNADPSRPNVGKGVTVMGWGDTDISDDVSSPSDVLMEVQVNVVSNQACDDSSGHIGGEPDNYHGQITENMLCAEADRRDSCQGDSGGPLIDGDVQVGVVSWGIGCAADGFPGVYARVSRAYDWIEREVCRGSEYASESGFDCSGVSYDPDWISESDADDGFDYDDDSRLDDDDDGSDDWLDDDAVDDRLDDDDSWLGDDDNDDDDRLDDDDADDIVDDDDDNWLGDDDNGDDDRLDDDDADDRLDDDDDNWLGDDSNDDRFDDGNDFSIGKWDDQFDDADDNGWFDDGDDGSRFDDDDDFDPIGTGESNRDDGRSDDDDDANGWFDDDGGDDWFDDDGSDDWFDDDGGHGWFDDDDFEKN